MVSAGNYSLNAYQVSDGVTFAVQGKAPTITYGVFAQTGGTGTSPFPNTGEGQHPASNYMAFAVPSLFDFPGVYTTSITVNFADAVSAVGFNTIDLASTITPITIQAFTGPNGTGSSLGAFTSYSPAFFQGNAGAYLYFMGLASTENDILSFKITGSWQNKSVGDAVGFDDFRFARVPEPATLAFLGLGTLGMLLKRRGGRR